MGRSFILLADDAKLQLLATCLLFVAVLLAAALVIALVKRWQRRRAAEEDCSPNAQLAHYRSLYEAGTISAEEFERLRAVLGGRLRDALGVPAPPVKPPQPKQPPPPDSPDTGIRPA
jgi:type VI protein secretion system component VasK